MACSRCVRSHFGHRFSTSAILATVLPADIRDHVAGLEGLLGGGSIRIDSNYRNTFAAGDIVRVAEREAWMHQTIGQRLAFKIGFACWTLGIFLGVRRLKCLTSSTLGSYDRSRQRIPFHDMG